MRVVHQKTNQQHRLRRRIPRRPSRRLNERITPKATSNLAHIIERYETLNAQSNPGTPLGIIALIFLLGGPILGFSALDSSADLEGAANVCCGGLIIGFVLLLFASSQSNAYEKEVKQAFEAVKAEVNVPKPPKTYTLLNTALAMMCGAGCWPSLSPADTFFSPCNRRDPVFSGLFTTVLGS